MWKTSHVSHASPPPLPLHSLLLLPTQNLALDTRIRCLCLFASASSFIAFADHYHRLFRLLFVMWQLQFSLAAMATAATVSSGQRQACAQLLDAECVGTYGTVYVCTILHVATLAVSCTDLRQKVGGRGKRKLLLFAHLSRACESAWRVVRLIRHHLHTSQNVRQ